MYLSNSNEIAWFVQSLKDRRISISARDGGIAVKPHLRLRQADIVFIKDNRDELLEYLQDPVGYELIRRAVESPPEFTEGEASNPSWVLTHEDWPVMVFSQSFVDTVTQWNQSIDARNQAAQAKQDAKAKSKKAQIKPTIIGTSDTSASDL